MRMWKVLKMKMSGTSWPCEDKTLLEKWFIWQIMATRTSLANLKHCQVTAFYKHFAATRRYFAARRRYFPAYRRYFSAQRRYLMSILSIREKQPISSGWMPRLAPLTLPVMNSSRGGYKDQIGKSWVWVAPCLLEDVLESATGWLQSPWTWWRVGCKLLLMVCTRAPWTCWTRPWRRRGWERCGKELSRSYWGPFQPMQRASWGTKRPCTVSINWLLIYEQKVGSMSALQDAFSREDWYKQII